jgi:hypothetical protein
MARTYTAPEIMELIQAMRASGDVPAEQLVGMQKLGQLLEYLDGLSEADIENEVKRYMRHPELNGAERVEKALSAIASLWRS